MERTLDRGLVLSRPPTSLTCLQETDEILLLNMLQVVNFFSDFHVCAKDKPSFYACASTLISNQLKVSSIRENADEGNTPSLILSVMLSLFGLLRATYAAYTTSLFFSSGLQNPEHPPLGQLFFPEGSKGCPIRLNGIGLRTECDEILTFFRHFRIDDAFGS